MIIAARLLQIVSYMIAVGAVGNPDVVLLAIAGGLIWGAIINLAREIAHG